MPISALNKRPYRFYRYDTTDGALGIAGVEDSGGAPSYGWETISIHMVLTQAGTLVVYQRLRASSTWAITNTFAYLAAGVLDTVIPVTAEMVKIIFTNGGVAQAPEILCGLAAA